MVLYMLHYHVHLAFCWWEVLSILRTDVILECVVIWKIRRCDNMKVHLRSICLKEDKGRITDSIVNISY